MKERRFNTENIRKYAISYINCKFLSEQNE